MLGVGVPVLSLGCAKYHAQESRNLADDFLSYQVADLTTRVFPGRTVCRCNKLIAALITALSNVEGTIMINSRSSLVFLSG